MGFPAALADALDAAVAAVVVDERLGGFADVDGGHVAEDEDVVAGLHELARARREGAGGAAEEQRP